MMSVKLETEGQQCRSNTLYTLDVNSSFNDSTSPLLLNSSIE
jgi:hypothetical protein